MSLREEVAQKTIDRLKKFTNHLESSYFDLVKPTYIENWPAALCSLSIAQVKIPLGGFLPNVLMAFNGEFGGGEPPRLPTKLMLDDIQFNVKKELNKFPKGAFIRLGSRSPKDSWLAAREGGMRVTDNDEDPLRFLLDSSERIDDDLLLAITNNYVPHLFLREWVDIPKWAEFRCFMAGRKLQGISQYNYFDGAFSEIVAEPDYFRWAIEKFFHELFLPAIHLDDVVFDVFFKIRFKGNQRQTEVRLLEINPYFEMTDPCLFKWGEEFAGEFRFNR